MPKITTTSNRDGSMTVYVDGRKQFRGKLELALAFQHTVVRPTSPFPHWERAMGPVCGPHAIAIAAHLPLDRVMQQFAARRSQGWRGRTGYAERVYMMRELGVPHESVGVRLIRGWLPTLRHIVDNVLKPDHTYICQVNGHVVTVRDGWVSDQHKCCPLTESRSRRCRVKSILLIRT